MHFALKPENPPCPLNAGIVIGTAVGALFEGVVLGQLLGWHSAASTWYPVDSVHNLNTNRIWDGVLQVGTYLLLTVGLFMLIRSAHSYDRWSILCLAGAVLMGWGAFNLVEGIVVHEALGIHHANERASADGRFVWDLILLGWGAASLACGIILISVCKTK
jgi:uncharacterized membrane protein